MEAMEVLIRVLRPWNIVLEDHRDEARQCLVCKVSVQFHQIKKPVFLGMWTTYFQELELRGRPEAPEWFPVGETYFGIKGTYLQTLTEGGGAEGSFESNSTPTTHVTKRGFFGYAKEIGVDCETRSKGSYKKDPMVSTLQIQRTQELPEGCSFIEMNDRYPIKDILFLEHAGEKTVEEFLNPFKTQKEFENEA